MIGEYKITYFNAKAQRIVTKTFKGKNAFTSAYKWGKKNLENFNIDLIRTVII